MVRENRAEQPLARSAADYQNHTAERAVASLLGICVACAPCMRSGRIKVAVAGGVPAD